MRKLSRLLSIYNLLKNMFGVKPTIFSSLKLEKNTLLSISLAHESERAFL